MSGGRPGEVSVRWVARRLGLHVKTVRRWCSDGRIKSRAEFGAKKPGGGHYPKRYWIQRVDVDRIEVEDYESGESGSNGSAPRVYFIESVSLGYVKIGTSIDPEKRVEDLQAWYPDRLRLIAVIPGGKIEEQDLHQRFKALAVRGEWYRLDGPLRTYLDGIACRGNTGEHPR